MEEKENEGLKEEKFASKSNLPVVQKDKELLAEGVKNDRNKRIFRIIKGATLGTLGIVAGLTLPGPLLASSLPVLASAGLGLGAIGGGFYAAVKYYNEAVNNSLYKIEDDLMFLGKQERDGSLGIYQSTRLNLAEHMKGYTNREKAGMMQLQGLIGFSRHKDNLANSSYTVRPDGTKVYDQLFSTKTQCFAPLLNASIPIAPLPQHKSQTSYSLSLSIIFRVSSTNISVSPLGISTPSST